MRIATLLFCLLALPHACAAPAVLDAWLKRQASIRTLECNFTQERKLPALKEPVTTTGKLSFAKPGKVRWQLGNPPETIAISDGTTLTLLDVGKKIARQQPANSPQAARFSLLNGQGFESPEAFKAAFEVIHHQQAGKIHQFALKSRDRRLRAQVPWIYLDIDPATNDLRSLEIELQDRSRIRTIFHKPTYNPNLPPTLFQPDLTPYTLK